MDNKEIKPVNPKENQLSIFTGRTDAEAEVLKLKLQYFGHLMRRTDLLEKTLTGKDWERLKAGGEGETEDEMVGWHH